MGKEIQELVPGTDVVLNQFVKDGNLHKINLLVSNSVDNCFGAILDVGKFLKCMSDNTVVELFTGQAGAVGAMYKLTSTHISSHDGHSRQVVEVRWSKITTFDHENKVFEYASSTKPAALDTPNAEITTFKFAPYDDGSGALKSLLNITMTKEEIGEIPLLFKLPCFWCMLPCIFAAIREGKADAISRMQAYFDGAAPNVDNDSVMVPIAHAVAPAVQMMDGGRGVGDGNVGPGNFCSFCGAKRDGGGRFCSSCGQQAVSLG
jgi:hypothetical protein